VHDAKALVTANPIAICQECIRAKMVLDNPKFGAEQVRAFQFADSVPVLTCRLQVTSDGFLVGFVG
jgi:hypothetical protein